MSRYTDLAKRVSAIEFALNNTQRDISVVAGNLAGMIETAAVVEKLSAALTSLELRVADLEAPSADPEPDQSELSPEIITAESAVPENTVPEEPAAPHIADQESEQVVEEDLQKPKRKLNTKYNTEDEWLNSVQLRDKYRGREIELFGRKNISTMDINRAMTDAGFAEPYNRGKGLGVTRLGMMTGLLSKGEKGGHIAFKNCDDTDELLSMLFLNRLKSKAYINNLKAEMESAA